MPMKTPEISPTMVGIITIGVLLIVMLYSGSQVEPFLKNAKTSVSEAPLHKNTKLQLRGKEHYVYSYHMNDTIFNMSFSTIQGPGCLILKYDDSPDAFSCIHADGTDDGGSNATLSNPFLVPFKPWMLAVDKPWSWNTTMSISYGRISEHISSASYKVIRRNTYRGRLAYVVRLESEDSDDVLVWVDKDKRILLKEEGPNYKIELVEGLDVE